MSLVLFLMGGTGHLANVLLRSLQGEFPPMTHPQWGARNAVVILGAGMEPPRSGQPPQPTMWGDSRILEGLRLYRTCRAEGRPCVVLVSGGDPHQMGVSEAEIYGRLLIQLGLDPADLRLETQSLNTFKNAELSLPLLRAEKVERVVLVTSGIHEKRSLLFFSHFGVQAQGAASDAVWAQSGWVPLAMNLTLTDLALHELLGLARYRLYQAMGWNPARTKAGEA
jgi:uncharacterized SAM-binding protein YcdF (DUF218 family)